MLNVAAACLPSARSMRTKTRSRTNPLRMQGPLHGLPTLHRTGVLARGLSYDLATCTLRSGIILPRTATVVPTGRLASRRHCRLPDPSMPLCRIQSVGPRIDWRAKKRRNGIAMPNEIRPPHARYRGLASRVAASAKKQSADNPRTRIMWTLARLIGRRVLNIIIAMSRAQTDQRAAANSGLPITHPIAFTSSTAWHCRAVRPAPRLFGASVLAAPEFLADH
jgi:hypothetical protein